MLFHGDGYNRWFDKAVSLIVTPNGVLGANVEHTPLDATVCGQMWEYVLTEERYDADGRCVEMCPGEKPMDTPNPTQSVPPSLSLPSLSHLPSPSLPPSLPYLPLPPSFPSSPQLLICTLLFRLKWEVDDIQSDLTEAAIHLSRMTQDSDLRVITPSYGKVIPKKYKLSPDGWFQVKVTST